MVELDPNKQKSSQNLFYLNYWRNRFQNLIPPRLVDSVALKGTTRSTMFIKKYEFEEKKKKYTRKKKQ